MSKKFLNFLLPKKKYKENAGHTPSPPPRPGGTGGLQRRGSVIAGRRITPQEESIRLARKLRFGELWSSVWALLMNNREDLKVGGGAALRYNAGALSYISKGLSELCTILHNEARDTLCGEAPPCYELLLNRDVVKLMCEYCNPSSDPRVTASPIYVQLLAFISDIVIFAGGSEERPLLGQHKQIISPLVRLLNALSEFADAPPSENPVAAPQMLKVRYSLLYIMYGIAHQLQKFPHCLIFFLEEPQSPGAKGTSGLLLAKLCQGYIGSDDYVFAEIFFAEEQRANPNYDLITRDKRNTADRLASSQRTKPPRGADPLSSSMRSASPMGEGLKRSASYSHGAALGVSPPSPQRVGRSPTHETHLHDEVAGKRLYLSDLAVEVLCCLAACMDEASHAFFEVRAEKIAERLLTEIVRLRGVARGIAKTPSLGSSEAMSLVVIYDRIGVVARQLDSICEGCSSQRFSNILLHGIAGRLLGTTDPFSDCTPFLSVVNEEEANFAGFFLSVLKPAQALAREVLIWACQKPIQRSLISTARGDRNSFGQTCLRLLEAVLLKTAEGSLGDSVDASDILPAEAGNDAVVLKVDESNPSHLISCCNPVRIPLSFSLLYMNGLSRGAAITKYTRDDTISSDDESDEGNHSRTDERLVAQARCAPVLGSNGGALRVFRALGVHADLQKAAAKYHEVAPGPHTVSMAPLSDSFADDIFSSDSGSVYAEVGILDRYVVPEKNCVTPDDLDAFLIELLRHIQPGGWKDRGFLALYCDALCRPRLLASVYCVLLALGGGAGVAAGEVVNSLRQLRTRPNRVLHANVIQNVDHLFHHELMWTLDLLPNVRSLARKDAAVAVASRNGCTFLVTDDLVFTCGTLLREAAEVPLDGLVAALSIISLSVMFSPMLTYRWFAPDSALLASLAEVKKDISATLGGLADVRGVIKTVRGQLGLGEGGVRASQALREATAPYSARLGAWCVLEEWRLELNALLEAIANQETLMLLGVSSDEVSTRRRAGAMAPRVQ